MAAACGGEAAAARPPLAFSPHDRRFLAVSGSDGRIRVWDAASSRLQHEYVPSAHLSAACTCLAWAPPGGRPPPDKVRADRGKGIRGRSARTPRGLELRPRRFTPPSRRHAAGPGSANGTGPARATCGAAARDGKPTGWRGARRILLFFFLIFSSKLTKSALSQSVDGDTPLPFAFHAWKQRALQQPGMWHAARLLSPPQDLVLCAQQLRAPRGISAFQLSSLGRSC